MQQRDSFFLLTKKNQETYFRLNKTKPRSGGRGGRGEVKPLKERKTSMINAETFCIFNLNTATVRADRENFYTKRYTQRTRPALLSTYVISHPRSLFA